MVKDDFTNCNVITVKNYARVVRISDNREKKRKIEVFLLAKWR